MATHGRAIIPEGAIMQLSTLGVLEHVEAALPACKDVRIDLDAIDRFSAAISLKELTLPTWDYPVFLQSSSEALAGQILLFNSINFCYWGEPQWQVAYAGQMWHGSLAMLAAIARAVHENVPILEGAYLAHLTETDLSHILREATSLHLMSYRHAILTMLPP